jgi:hypothetical protein
MSAPFSRSLDQLPAATRNAVTALHHGLVRTFGDDLAAIWLYGGSLFNDVALDIDLHILLARKPEGPQGDKIRELHSIVSRNERWVDEFDSWYILLDDARRSEPPPNVGPWHPGLPDSHWSLHRAHWLAGACIIVHGLAPSDVVQTPVWEELERPLRGELVEEAKDGGAEGAAASPYWALQLCRVLASLATRDVVRSKLDSGSWALQKLPQQTHEIIHAAMRHYTRSSEEEDEELIRRLYPDFYRVIRLLIDEAGREPAQPC